MKLEAGDLMLKFNAGSMTNKAIALGQRLRGQANYMIVHAGVMFDSHYIIESSGPGLVAHDIRVQNVAYGYLVFRPTDSNMASGAGTCAKMMYDIHCSQHNLSYSVSNAFLSLFRKDPGANSRSEFDRLFGKIIAGKSHPFFCSHFVVWIYQFVAEQLNMSASSVFHYRDTMVNPSKLATDLVHNSKFREAGYLMPNER